MKVKINDLFLQKICICFSILLVLNVILMQYINNDNNDYSAHAYVTNNDYEQFPIIYNDTNLKAELVFKGLKFPTSMAFLSPNDILVIEKNNGSIKRILNGAMSSKPLINVSVATQGGRGMLGINVAKHGKSGPTYVFLYYIESSNEKELEAKTGGKAVLYRYELKDDKLTEPKLLLDLSGQRGVGNSSEEFHNGGKIVIGPDQNIYLIVGEFSGRHTATTNIHDGDPADGSSGILRINQDGLPIRDGRVLGGADPLNKYYAYGIRNSFGMHFDPVTHNLWDTENGALYGDEINLVRPGFNSGYSVVQGIWYIDQLNQDKAAGLAPRNPDGLVDFEGRGKYSPPEFTWYYPIAPTALIFFDSDRMGKQYRDDMFVADFNGGKIYHFKLNENRTALSLRGALADKLANTDAESKSVIFAGGFKGITDMQVGPDGYLYILSYNNGEIFRIVPARSIIPKQVIMNLLDKNHVWKHFGQTTLSQNNETLAINVDSNLTKKTYNRAFLATKINYLQYKTLLLNLDYASKSRQGNGTFMVEIGENSANIDGNVSRKILWSSLLHDTSGKLTNESFILPENIVNKPVEFRLYIITDDNGQHTLTIRKANIVHS